VMGPTDEQPDYYEECKKLVSELNLDATLRFTGQVDVTQYLPRIHVNVLTSVSESQPLSVLEAGAAALPTVASNVGACREILFGRRDDQLGAGGILTDVASAEQTAAAIGELLRDHDRRTRFGLIMQQRVQRYYDLGIVDEAYATIYRHHMAAQAQGVA
jgi:polysaccharide biosynthesis protein PelF